MANIDILHCPLSTPSNGKPRFQNPIKHGGTCVPNTSDNMKKMCTLTSSITTSIIGKLITRFAIGKHTTSTCRTNRPSERLRALYRKRTERYYESNE